MSVEFFKEYMSTRRADGVLCQFVSGSLGALLFVLLMSPKYQFPTKLHADKAPAVKDIKRRQRRSFSVDALDRPHPSSYKQFLFLLRIALRSLRSWESGMLMILSALLLLRTYLSLRVLRVSMQLSKIIIDCDLFATMKGVMRYMGWCTLSTLTDSSAQYCTGLLGLQIQSNLSQYFYRQYLTQDVFFSLALSNNVEEVDQRVTKDIESWSASLMKMYTSLFKPIIEFMIFSYKVASLSGVRSPLIILGYYTGFAVFAYTISSDLESIVNEQLTRNGALITAHQRLIPFAEEYVMTQGQSFHLSLMNRYLKCITEHQQWAAYIRGAYGLIETFALKYGSVVLSSAVCGAAVFNNSTEGMSTTDIMSICVESLYLFRKLTGSIRIILQNIKQCFTIRALTHRVYELQEGIEQAKEEMSGMGVGEVIRGNHIEFDNVPIVLPTGKVLCESLSFYVKPGMNLLVVGPNGCGKSSMVRFLGGLWPIQGGCMTKPKSNQIYYIPQRPYMSNGTLRDQITYPLYSDELHVSESQLMECLQMAMLDDIFSKPNITWDSVISWEGDTLSLGEKQKLAMARLFFHRPCFAILDECSSMMDVEVEERLYRMCHQLGISLITIAHRRSIWRHHNWILHFDGCGGFMFSPIVFSSQGVVILKKIMHASDASLIGQEVVLDLSEYDESEKL